MALIVLRCVFLMVASGVGVAILSMMPTLFPDAPAWISWVIFLGMIGLALAVIAVDVLLPRKPVDVISSVYFGLLVGLFLAYVMGLALTPLFAFRENPALAERVPAVVQLILAVVLCYVCISFLLQTRNDFRFIIPYVQFSKDVRGRRPIIMDTSVVIDGRIADVMETKALDNQLVMPRFIITELQSIADSPDRLRRSRGRRGLDILNRLRTNPDVELQIFDRDLPEFAGQTVDLKLVSLAKHMEGKLITNDYNLNKVARLHGVEVINLNDLANALKPVFLPGERIEVRVIKPGEEMGQGVGYLDDGTMVVVEGGRDHINETVSISVTSVLQTSAGRMVFGKYETTIESNRHRSDDHHHRSRR
ncbi:MAG TPA: TRAM domain-containing protein [Planctomycetaceae bacterium]|nr:TRAM domain-containing protein [Planctomycetaceae bacterium]HIQ21773.1 TRAM domain-containing protein [Planctomycetota bacterium]